MASLKNYIQAARLRTLPLSVSGILFGSAIAAREECFNGIIFTLAILTTIGFQVLSNFANDYGDGVKGTDSEREGEQRMVATGAISASQMKNAMIYTVVITMVIAIALIYSAFAQDFLRALLFFVLGLASIVAAIKYTVGDNAYGYSGLGDVFVFLFFGLLSVIGSYYLYSKTLEDFSIILPAAAIGLLSAAVLNLNNMRDQLNDKKSNKNTLVVKLGSQWAKKYHYTLIFGAIGLLITYGGLHFNSVIYWLFVIAFIPLIKNVIVVARNIIFSELDGELKKVAIGTFLISLISFIVAFF